MLRLVVDSKSMDVVVMPPAESERPVAHGRSAYLCAEQKCVDQALKGTRLRFALEGRRVKGVEKRRTIRWPLEPQLMNDMSRLCTDTGQTCKNTLEKEGGE